MSFTVRCPFCKSEMDAPDEALGEVAQCTSCGREIDLEPVNAAPPAPVEDPNAHQIRTARAAAIASIPTTMPRVTWS